MLTFLHPETVNRFLKENHLQDFSPGIDFLKRLTRLFQKIPYENMTKLIRSRQVSDPEIKIRLPELLYGEHLRYGTGGTCFSMTYFMQTILRSTGFSTYPIIADRPLASNTHCASIVVIDNEKFLIDPGFMIDEPISLTRETIIHELKHTTIILGEAASFQIPAAQLQYFRELKEKGGSILPYEENGKERYCLATYIGEKTTVRYFIKDIPLTTGQFLDFWLDSFNWPSLHNISLTVTTDNGCIYARNNFVRTTTKMEKRGERLKKDIDLTLGKLFNIDLGIIRAAFDTLEGVKKDMDMHLMPPLSFLRRQESRSA